MADSAIVITSVVKSGGAGQNLLIVTTSGGGENECLPYMTLSKVEIYASKTNNRGTATKIGDTTGTFVHGNLGVSETWYYWFRAIDNNDPPLVGEWYPFSSTDGVVATTSNQVPPPNSVGTPQLQDGAATAQKIANLAVGSAHIQALAVKTANIDNLQVTDAKMVSMSAAKLTAGVITATITMNTPVINGGSINGARLTVTGGNFNSPMVDLGGTAQTNISTVRITQGGNNSEAVLWAINSGSGTTCHAIRGTKTLIPGGDVSSGLVGAANGYSFYTEFGLGVGPFTGAHDAFIRKDHPSEPGMVIADRKVLFRNGISDGVTRVEVTSEAMDPTAWGVIVQRSSFDGNALLGVLGPQQKEEDDYPRKEKLRRAFERGLIDDLEYRDFTANPKSPLPPAVEDIRRPRGTALKRHLGKTDDQIMANGVGEGSALVCGRGGNIKSGDLLCTSDMPGHLMKQPPFVIDGQEVQLVTNYTFAKVREAYDFAGPDDRKLLLVFYYGG